MSTLVAAGRVTRRVVGMYLGTGYARAGGDRNGSVVFGGDDAGQIDGPAHEYRQVTVPAPGYSSLRLRVKQVTLVAADGRPIPLATDTGFDGYLSTDQYAVEFPAPVTQALATAIGAVPARNTDDTLRAIRPFIGNLTVTLDDGYQITYPSEWITNTSNLTHISAVPMNSSSSIDRPLVLGAAFLHHLYLTIDYDSNSFFLAKAKIYNNYIQPASLCSNTIPVAASLPATSKLIRSGLAGAVLGGVVGLLGVSFMIFWMSRKNLQARALRKRVDEMDRGVRTHPLAAKKSSLRRKSRTKLFFCNKTGKTTRGVSFLTPQKPSFESSSTASTGNTAFLRGSRLRAPEISAPAASCSMANAGRAPRNTKFAFEPTPTVSHALLHPHEKYSYIADDDISDIPQQQKQKPVLHVDTKAIRRGDCRPTHFPVQIASYDGDGVRRGAHE